MIQEILKEFDEKFIIKGAFTGVEFIDESRIPELKAFLEKSLKRVEEKTKKVCNDCGYDPVANHECNSPIPKL
jgi:hypothetical protein